MKKLKGSRAKAKPGRPGSGGGLKGRREAAALGDAGARLSLGVARACGLGLPIDRAKAIERRGKAAEKGRVGAQARLGPARFIGAGAPACAAKAAGPRGKAAEKGGVGPQGGRDKAIEWPLTVAGREGAGSRRGLGGKGLSVKR